MENFLEDYSKLLDDSKAHLSNATIATYINLKEQLSSKERDFIESHIRNCSKCKEKYEVIRAEDIEIDTGATKQPNLFRIANYWRYAAAAVIVIGVIVVFYFSLSSKNEDFYTEEVITTDSLKTTENISIDSATQFQKPESTMDSEKNKELFAANDVLENFIHRNVRSESKIEIISPELGDTVSTVAKYKWKLISPANELILIIVNNKNKSVYQTFVTGNELTINKKFNSGIYYWKLEADGKLEAVGKIFVIN